MGKKTSPIALRAERTNWSDVRWFGNYSKNLVEDKIIREFFEKELPYQEFEKISIQRSGERLVVKIHSHMCKKLIGAQRENLQKLENNFKNYLENKKIHYKVCKIGMFEILRPGLSAILTFKHIKAEIEEKRADYRRVLNACLKKSMSEGALGISIKLSGRLNGASIARTETFKRGLLPLQRLECDIDFYVGQIQTKSGIVGCKVYISGGIYRS